MQAGLRLDVVVVFAEVLLVGETHCDLLIENNNRTCQYYHINEAVKRASRQSLLIMD